MNDYNYLKDQQHDYSIRFCKVFPDYNTFKINVIDKLLFANEPTFTWVVLYELLNRRFSENNFKVQTRESAYLATQEIIDRILPDYNNIWKITLSNYINNLTVEDLLNNGVISIDDDVVLNQSNLKDIVTKIYKNPQLISDDILNENYITEGLKNIDGETVTATTTKDTKQINNTKTINERLIDFINNNVVYNFTSFYRNFSQIFITYKGACYYEL